MRWPWQRRTARQAEPSVPHVPTWATAAFPPAATARSATDAPSGTHEALPQSTPAVDAGQALPVIPAQALPAHRVRLVFDDGSELPLDAADPRAVALRAVADVLLKGD